VILFLQEVNVTYYIGMFNPQYLNDKKTSFLDFKLTLLSVINIVRVLLMYQGVVNFVNS
jgi:hypothetical protein